MDGKMSNIPGALIAANISDKYLRSLESDIADLIERIQRLEGARPPPQDDALLSQEKAAAVLGMKPATLSSWRAKGKGPKFHQVGRSAFYRRQDILDWIDQQAVTPKGTAI